MSLLLDARKKAQQSHGGNSGRELSLEEIPNAASASPADERARQAGQNLFNAKNHGAMRPQTGINRNILIALGATVLLLAAGAGYVWYQISPGTSQPLRPMPPPAMQNNVTAQMQSNPAMAAATAKAIPETKVETVKPAHAPRLAGKAQAHGRHPVLVEQHQDEPIDPLLNDAYRAYRNGKYEQAQEGYSKVLKLDARNADALLGLAAISQRRGEDSQAIHYYSEVLVIDPRNAVANAGMSALTTGDGRESRLKNLLNEQQNSSSLHFALGNQFAEQSRWAEAQQEYFNAYKLEPDNAELAYNLAVSLDRLGQQKLAAQYYQRALQLDSSGVAGFDHAKISQHIEDLTH